MSGNTTATGIYGGFSYLNSPTDKTAPPRSPRLSAWADSHGAAEEAEERQPFSYLAPSTPADRAPSPTPVFDQRESYDNSRRLPRDVQGSTLPGQHTSNKIGGNPNYYTSAQDFTRSNENDHTVGELYNNRIIDNNKDKQSAYIVPDYPTGRGEEHIPRPRVGGSSSSGGGGGGLYSEPKDYYSQQNMGYAGNEYNEQPMSPSSKSRPISRDSYLDGSSKKGRCGCCVVCVVIVLVILALGAGFAAGWFASQAVNGTDGVAGNITTVLTTTSLTPVPASLTTTQVPVTPAPAATTTTTTQAPVPTPPPTLAPTTTTVADSSTTPVQNTTTSTP